MGIMQFLGISQNTLTVTLNSLGYIAAIASTVGLLHQLKKSREQDTQIEKFYNQLVSLGLLNNTHIDVSKSGANSIVSAIDSALTKAIDIDAFKYYRHIIPVEGKWYFTNIGPTGIRTSSRIAAWAITSNGKVIGLIGDIPTGGQAGFSEHRGTPTLVSCPPVCGKYVSEEELIVLCTQEEREHLCQFTSVII